MLLVRSVDLPSPNRMGSVFCGGGGGKTALRRVQRVTRGSATGRAGPGFAAVPACAGAPACRALTAGGAAWVGGGGGRRGSFGRAAESIPIRRTTAWCCR